MSVRSTTALRYAAKKVRIISRLLIIMQDSIYRQLGLTSLTSSSLIGVGSFSS